MFDIGHVKRFVKYARTELRKPCSEYVKARCAHLYPHLPISVAKYLVILPSAWDVIELEAGNVTINDYKLHRALIMAACIRFVTTKLNRNDAKLVRVWLSSIACSYAHNVEPEEFVKEHQWMLDGVDFNAPHVSVLRIIALSGDISPQAYKYFLPSAIDLDIKYERGKLGLDGQLLCPVRNDPDLLDETIKVSAKWAEYSTRHNL